MRPALEVELAEDALHVHFSGAFANDQRRGDLAVAQAARNLRGHFALAGGERINPRRHGGIRVSIRVSELLMSCRLYPSVM